MVAMTLAATWFFSAVMRSSTFNSSTVAEPAALPRGLSSFGRLCGSRARPRSTAATMSLPHLERSKPFGIERRFASFSSDVGAWVAMSPIASSFSTRLRGTSRVCASRSRQAAISISTASSFGLRTRDFSRSQARDGSLS